MERKTQELLSQKAQDVPRLQTRITETSLSAPPRALSRTRLTRPSSVPPPLRPVRLVRGLEEKLDLYVIKRETEAQRLSLLINMAPGKDDCALVPLPFSLCYL